MSDVPGLKQHVADALRISVDEWSDDMLMGAFVALGVARQRGIAVPSRQQDVIEAVREWVACTDALTDWVLETGLAIELAPEYLLEAVDKIGTVVFKAFEDLDRWERKVAG